MPLDDAALGLAIQTQLQTIGNVTNPSELQAFANALGRAIVEYIKANAVVQGTVTTGQGAGGQIIGTVG